MEILRFQGARLKPYFYLIPVLLSLTGCTTANLNSVKLSDSTQSSNQSKTDKITLNIDGLKKCANSKDNSIQISPDMPVTILVHGCFSSAGKFRALADVYNLNEQQAVCFEYNDRDDLEVVSGNLAQAINELAVSIPDQTINIIGHSQGGLISRRSLIANRNDNIRVEAHDIHLTTISSPFNGITASSHCGIEPLRIFSFGMVDLICYAVTGNKYRQITPSSYFVNHPGDLVPSVTEHLLIKTDEEKSCRTFDNTGHCIEDDFVFSLDEQSNPMTDKPTNVKALTVKAGHVEIVGNETYAPTKLLKILYDNHLLHLNNENVEYEISHIINRVYLEPQLSI